MLRRILFMALAIIAAAMMFVFVKNAKKPAIKNNQEQAVVQQQPENFVLVAAKNMSAGTFVAPETITWQAWPETGLNDAFITKSNNEAANEKKLEEFYGTVVRRGLVKGEPISSSRIIKPGDRGFVAAILQKGMRAVSVQVNAQSAIAGLAFPGDKVDILLTHSIRQPDNEERPVRQVAETILEDVRILAMDQKVDDQNAAPSVPKTATLEVTPKQAEILMVATQIGRLSLTLRALTIEDASDEKISNETDSENISLIEASVADGNKDIIVPEERVRYTLDGEASQILSNDMMQRKVQIIRGSVTENVTIQGDE